MLRDRVVLLNELIDGHKSATDSQYKVVVLHHHDHLVCEVAVAPFSLPHEQALDAFLRITFVDEISQFSIDRVVFLCDILEVHFMQLTPVLQHLVKLRVTVTE